MKNKAFTLIELLAVIIILGILMLIAIPSVTNYINNSRKSTYINTVNQLVKATIAKVNSGDLNMFDTDTTYYVPCTCIKLENGEAKSPYGKFDPAYVVVTFDGDNYHYYFTGKDVQNMGVPTLTSADILSKESIVANVEAIDTTVGIEGTSNVYVFSDECNGEGEIGPTGTTVSGGSGFSGGSHSGGSPSFKGICKKATTLHSSTCKYNCTSSNCGCGVKIGYGNTITYGTIPSGTPKGGDAYDCDVNNDGIYDSETERFYYVSDYYDPSTNTFDNTKSTLIYYTNFDEYPYASVADALLIGTCTFQYGCNWYGPLTAYKYLPSTSEWTNPKIISPGTRQIKNESGTGTTYNTNTYRDNIIQSFTYTDKAARFLTTQELMEGCSSITQIWNNMGGELDGCTYLLENLGGYEKERGTTIEGYWLETPRSDYSYLTWTVEGYYRHLYNIHPDVTENFFIRPVITILKSNIQK